MTPNALVLKYRDLPAKLAHKLRVPPALFEDARAAGTVGLIEAAHRFDPGQGFKFLTFAWHRVAGEIQTFLKTETKAARPPHDHAAEHHVRPVDASDSRFEVAAILARLPTRERDLLDRVYLQGQTQAKAAGTVRGVASRRVNRALALARGVLE